MISQQKNDIFFSVFALLLLAVWFYACVFENPEISRFCVFEIKAVRTYHKWMKKFKLLSVWCSTCIILLTMKSVVQTNRSLIALMSLCPLLVRYFLILSYRKASIMRPLSNKCPPSIFRNRRLFEFDKYELEESIRD